MKLILSSRNGGILSFLMIAFASHMYASNYRTTSKKQKNQLSEQIISTYTNVLQKKRLQNGISETESRFLKKDLIRFLKKIPSSGPTRAMVMRIAYEQETITEAIAKLLCKKASNCSDLGVGIYWWLNRHQTVPEESFLSFCALNAPHLNRIQRLIINYFS